MGKGKTDQTGTGTKDEYCEMGPQYRFNWYQESTLLLLVCRSLLCCRCWLVLISAAEQTTNLSNRLHR